jgi:RNA polymerase sigma factor (sigma-70 family)
MSGSDQTDRDLLEAIRRGDSTAWSRLVDEYQGRLLRFATARVPQHADAEDIVQETFTAFVKVANSVRIESTLETYLFSILRNEIANRFRTRWAKTVCLIQDVYHTSAEDGPADSFAWVASADPSVSWCVSHDEQCELLRQALTRALRRLIKSYQEGAKFRDLKVADLVFYCQVPNIDVARLLALDESLVRVVKHRCLKHIREDIAANDAVKDISITYTENLLTEIWESQRLSCPKRSTLGAFLLETLSPEWFDYVDFHLTTLGCHFCRASFKDLHEQYANDQHSRLHQRILTSTAGFLSKP